MRPDEPRITPIPPERQALQPTSSRPYDTSQQAAASIVREQINTIYNNPVADSSTQYQSAQNSSSAEPDAYHRTHSGPSTTASQEQWKKYHSAWQEYYQKYYERYYVGEVYKAQKSISEKIQPSTVPSTNQQPSQPQQSSVIGSGPSPQSLSRADALSDLRRSLRNSVTEKTKKSPR